MPCCNLTFRKSTQDNLSLQAFQSVVDELLETPGGGHNLYHQGVSPTGRENFWIACAWGGYCSFLHILANWAALIVVPLWITNSRWLFRRKGGKTSFDSWTSMCTFSKPWPSYPSPRTVRFQTRLKVLSSTWAAALLPCIFLWYAKLLLICNICLRTLGNDLTLTCSSRNIDLIKFQVTERYGSSSSVKQVYCLTFVVRGKPMRGHAWYPPLPRNNGFLLLFKCAIGMKLFILFQITSIPVNTDCSCIFMVHVLTWW